MHYQRTTGEEGQSLLPLGKGKQAPEARLFPTSPQWGPAWVEIIPTDGAQRALEMSGARSPVRCVQREREGVALPRIDTRVSVQRQASAYEEVGCMRTIGR